MIPPLRDDAPLSKRCTRLQSRAHLYLVMEFVNSGDLFSLLRNVGYLEEELALTYVAEISCALEYLHNTLGVVHRDLKPDNVLICADGHIKLTDFGLSVIGLAEHSTMPPPLVGLDAASNEPLTWLQAELYAKVGSPDYMAPELLLGERHGPPVDLWALGCVTFELLTGYPPFTGETAEDVFGHVLDHLQCDSIRWPEEEGHFSTQASGFIRSLLIPSADCRLGANDFNELHRHDFFRGIDWALLREREGNVPFVPQLDGQEDVSYFVSKEPISPRTQPLPSPLCARQASEDDGGAPDDDTETAFLNFDYQNFASLARRNLELASAENASTSPPTFHLET